MTAAGHRAVLHGFSHDSLGRFREFGNGKASLPSRLHATHGVCVPGDRVAQQQRACRMHESMRYR
jgi:hypothetical protein